MLARAFEDDPVWAWVLRDEGRRRRVLPWTFARIVALEARRAHVVGLGGVGVALWVAPGTRRTTRGELLRSQFPLLPVRLGREGNARLQSFQRASRDMLVRIGYGSAWFLSGLGVEPAAQRRGVGTALVRWGLERAARDGTPAVLLTSAGANIPFYERLGFGVVEVGELPPGGPPTWAMRWGAKEAV